MFRTILTAFVMIAMTPHAALAQGNPLGPEFRVNTYTFGSQQFASVAASAQGFVVVWASNVQDGNNFGIFGQRYATSGAPLGGEFRVNTYTPGRQWRPDVASNALGNFVVVWESALQDGSGDGIFGQRYDSFGAAVGPEFRVNTFTSGGQLRPSVAMDADGDFVVAWESLDQDGAGYGIFGQRYGSSGVPSGAEFRVNSYTTSHQMAADVDADPGGSFVVVWHSEVQDGFGQGVFSQRYDDAGAPLGPEFRVNTFTISHQQYPAVAMDRAATGNFVVVWVSSAQEGGASFHGIYAQRYAASGSAVGPEFHVNTYTPGSQVQAAVASDANGYFVVIWHDLGQDGSFGGIFGQRFDSAGSHLGPEFLVNTYTSSFQSEPAVAVDDSGRFVVAWKSFGQDGYGYGVFAQRYSLIVPVELMKFGVE